MLVSSGACLAAELPCASSFAGLMAEFHCACAGLNLLLELLVMFERSEFATQFHQTYYLQLMREIFVVMTGARASCCVMVLVHARCACAPVFCMVLPSFCCCMQRGQYLVVTPRGTIC